MSPERDIAGILLEQARYCAALGSPLYASLLHRAAADLRDGGPTLACLSGHEDDPPGSALALRFMGAVHRLVLQGDAPELARHYPSAGGQPDESSAWTSFRNVLETHRDAVRAGIERPVQTNEPGRCAALIGGFLESARRLGPRLRVLEVGASAGLNLRWDGYRYEARGQTWGPPDSPVRLCTFNTQRNPLITAEVEIVERRGCDPAPLDPGRPEDRLTLMSYVWPDQVRRLRLLRGALEVADRHPLRIERAGAVGWIGDRLGEDPEVNTIVFHSIVMQYLPRADRARFEDVVRAAGEDARPGRGLSWIRMEPAGDIAEVRMTVWPGGREAVVARTGYHGDPVEWLGLAD